MIQTKSMFLDNTYLFAILAKIMETGVDEKGNYFVTDRSIFYPQGGGQPADQGYISLSRQNNFPILSAKYTDNGIRHYTSDELPKNTVNSEISMHIFQDTRKLNAAYHTAGHWLSQIVLESMHLPLFPVKGHHFPGQSYLEFEGDSSCITKETIDELRMAMLIDIQADLKINVEISALGTKIFKSALIPKNFKPPVNKPLRFTQIEGYRWLPCGGTHVEALREIKSVQPIEFYNKGGNIRLSYNCETWQMIGS